MRDPPSKAQASEYILMKFGNFLHRNAVEEWRSQYLNYKSLKKAIRTVATAPEDGKLIAQEAFVSLFRNELNKMNRFYMKKESEYEHAFGILQQRVQRQVLTFVSYNYDYIEFLRNHNYAHRFSNLLLLLFSYSLLFASQFKSEETRTRTSVRILRKSIIAFLRHVNRLREFATINYTAVSKILKKHDKKTSSSLRAQIQPQVDTLEFKNCTNLLALMSSTGKLMEDAEQLRRLTETGEKSRGKLRRPLAITIVAVAIGLLSLALYSASLLHDWEWARSHERTIIFSLVFGLFLVISFARRFVEKRPESSLLRQMLSFFIWVIDLSMFLVLGTCPFGTAPMSSSAPVYASVKFSLIKLLPTNISSRLWGMINAVPLPLFARKPLYMLWTVAFNCKLHEMRYPLDSYACLGEFFSRPLKEGMRPLSEDGMVSPVDGRMVVCGEAVGDSIEQVKGLTYSLSSFLGLGSSVNADAASDSDSDAEEDDLMSALESDDPSSFAATTPSRKSKRSRVRSNGSKYSSDSIPQCPIKAAPGRKIYQCVIYLAPGDYHRIHSPCEWQIHKRKHFPGALLPVGPLAVKFIRGLFAMNERVVLEGEWDQGYFSLTSVGAYNVGSVALSFDKEVVTNNRWWSVNLRRKGAQPYGIGSSYDREYANGIAVERGEEVAYFKLGSTVVLVFEADEGFQFTAKPGQKVQMGELLGTYGQVRREK